MTRVTELWARERRAKMVMGLDRLVLVMMLVMVMMMMLVMGFDRFQLLVSWSSQLSMKSSQLSWFDFPG